MVLSGSQREIVVEDIAGGGWVVRTRACTHTHTHTHRERDRERRRRKRRLGFGFRRILSFNK